MSDHIERMKKEHSELEGRIKALSVFIHSNDAFKTLTDIEQVSMCKQLGYMEAYRRELDGRLWRSHNG